MPSAAAQDAGGDEPAVASRAGVDSGAARALAPRSSWLPGLALLGAALALVVAALSYQKLSSVQELLARQSAESLGTAAEAKALARQAQESVREATARLGVAEVRLSEVALQRGQLEDLIQSLSRSRDENLVVDIDSALRLAQQQAQLSGTVEPLLAALRSAEQRLARAAQPRLARLRAAIGRDLERVRAASGFDLPGLLLRLDDVARQVDELPLANGAPSAAPGSAPYNATTGFSATAPKPAASASSTSAPTERGAGAADKPATTPWWAEVWSRVQHEARRLLRVSRIDEPEAALLAPEQGFFLRENLKFRLLNARLSLLSRQTEVARADIAASQVSVKKYFDASARKTQLAQQALAQAYVQAGKMDLPPLDDSLAALATAAAGK